MSLDKFRPAPAGQMSAPYPKIEVHPGESRSVARVASVAVAGR